MKHLIYLLLAVCIISCNKGTDAPLPDPIDSVKSIYPYHAFYSGRLSVSSDFESLYGDWLFDTSYNYHVDVERINSDTVRIHFDYITQTMGSQREDQYKRTLRDDSYTTRINDKGEYINGWYFNDQAFYTFRNDSLIISHRIVNSWSGSIITFGGLMEL